jgi:antitoxin HicB
LGGHLPGWYFADAENMSARPTNLNMAHYIAIIHKDTDSCYGVYFPDVPGVFTAGDTIDEAIRKAGEVLEFAAGDWSDLSGDKFPEPRTIDELRADADFRQRAADAVVAAVPFRLNVEAVA